MSMSMSVALRCVALRCVGAFDSLEAANANLTVASRWLRNAMPNPITMSQCHRTSPSILFAYALGLVTHCGSIEDGSIDRTYTCIRRSIAETLFIRQVHRQLRKPFFPFPFVPHIFKGKPTF